MKMTIGQLASVMKELGDRVGHDVSVVFGDDDNQTYDSMSLLIVKNAEGEATKVIMGHNDLLATQSLFKSEVPEPVIISISAEGAEATTLYVGPGGDIEEASRLAMLNDSMGGKARKTLIAALTKALSPEMK